MIVASADDEQKLAKLDAELTEAKKRLDPCCPCSMQHKRVGRSTAKGSGKASPITKGLQATAELLAKDAKERKPKEREAIQTYFRTKVSTDFNAEREALTKASKHAKRINDKLPKCLVSIKSDKPRTVRILPRGDWMKDGGEQVQPRYHIICRKLLRGA